MGSSGERMRDSFSKDLEECGRLDLKQPPLQVRGPAVLINLHTTC